MALSKERKVLLGLLGSAGLILVVDQVLLGPPQNAQAESAAALPQTVATQHPVAEGPQPKPKHDYAKDAQDIGDWNERLKASLKDEAEGVPDPFQSVVPTAGLPTTLSAQDFQREHKLSAVLTSGEVSVAMVNGRAIRIGQEISGYRLLRVDARSAEFVAGDQIVKLLLPTQSSGGS
ncbi:MAG: hypothetical protein ACIAQU_10045 [Phycisphaerales bacterium JB064]